jgi:hypothetical protein
MIVVSREARVRLAKVALVDWFRSRGPGLPSKPSDAAFDLGMDPEVARKLCSELISDGVLGPVRSRRGGGI